MPLSAESASHAFGNTQPQHSPATESGREPGCAGSQVRSSSVLRRIPEGYQVEEVLTCECILPAHAIPANRDGEVMEIQQLPPAKVLEMLQAGAFTIEASIVITEDLLRRSLSTPGI